MSWKGTPVPSSGTLNSLYFNTNLSIEEVVNILSKLEYVANEQGYEMYNIFQANLVGTNFGLLYAVGKFGNIYGFMATTINDNGIVSQEVIFVSDQQEVIPTDFVGWNPIFLNNDNANTLEGGSLNIMSGGVSNDLLSSLISITPFEEEQEEVTLDSWAEGIADAIREKKGIESKEKWVGTEVPNSGLVDKLYINDKVSFQEIYNLVSSIEYAPYDDAGYCEVYIVLNCDGGSVFHILKFNKTDTPRGTEYNVYVDDNLVWISVNDEGFTTYGLNVLAIQQNYGYIPNTGEALDKWTKGTIEYDVGLQNDKISSLFSITPFEQKEVKQLIPRLNFAQEIRSIEGGNSIPTAVPISGMVEKVYFNFNVDVLKIGEMVLGLSYVQVPGVGNVYPIISNADMSSGLVLVKKSSDNCALTYSLNGQSKELVQIAYSNNESSIFIHDDIDFSQPLEFGFENMVSQLATQFPTYRNDNELLKEMISITPIQKNGGSSIVGYKGTTVPNEGYVEKVYLNTNLSKEDVNEIIKGITLTDYDGQVSDYILFSDSFAMLIVQYIENGELVDKYSIGGMNLTTGEEFVYFNGESWEEFENPIIINSEVFGSLEGFYIGIQNNKLLSLISITPFEEVSTEEFVEECSTAVLEAKGEKVDWQGTPVPNSGTINKIYFNTNLSNEEVKTLIDSLNFSWTDTDYSKGLIVACNDGDLLLVIMKQRTDTTVDFNYKIQLVDNSKSGDEQFTTYWSNNEGWVTSEIMLNMSLVSETNGIPVGEQNDKLSSLISTTKFIVKNSIYPTLIPNEIRKLSSGGSASVEGTTLVLGSASVTNNTLEI